MSTSNIRINTYKYSCHCRGEAEGDAQPLNNKRPAKSKADVILDTITKFPVSHCGKGTDWYIEKETKWILKLSNLAQGKGQSAPPEWMPLPVKGEISGRAADSRVEVPKQTSERVTRERVPQIITKDWTKANRDRANEVTLQLEPHVMYTLNYSEHGR